MANRPDHQALGSQTGCFAEASSHTVSRDQRTGPAMAGKADMFKGDDPLEIARAWLREAEASEPSDPNAVALASVDENGLPDIRMVLVKAIDHGFVFYSNYESAKGRQLGHCGKAAMNFHWKSLERQLRVRGRIERVTSEESDAYYKSRDLGSRIGAWASQQSRPLASRAALAKAVAEEGIRHGLAPSRPPHWGGFRLIPSEMEFWRSGEFRLHDRFKWVQIDNLKWRSQRLYP